MQVIKDLHIAGYRISPIIENIHFIRCTFHLFTLCVFSYCNFEDCKFTKAYPLLPKPTTKYRVSFMSRKETK